MSNLFACFCTVALFLSSSLSQELIHKCVHDKVQPFLYQMLHLKDASHRTTRMTQDYSTLRLHTEYDPSITNNPALLEEFTRPTGAFQKALSVLKNSFLVKPTVGNVTFTPSCAVRIRYGQNYGKCYKGFARENRVCGIFDVPRHMVGSIVTCDLVGPCGVEGASGPGVVADYVLFAGSANKVQCGRSTLAFGGVCGIDDVHLRPAAGFINVCYENIQNKKEKLRNDSLYNVFLHELLHAFGFTPELMQKFLHDSTGRFYSAYHLHQFHFSFVPGLNSTKLVKHARKHFNCSDLRFVPLENGGGSGSASAHWEARVLHHEVLMPFLSRDYMVVSNFTWAFFEDSGWYRINYTYTNSIDQLEMKWGKNKGCQFIFQTCTNIKVYPYACNENHDNISCTFDRHAKGVCTDKFSGFFDGCPVLLSKSTGSCLYMENSKSRSSSLELYSKQSRCFEYNSNRIGCFKILLYKHYGSSSELFYKVQGSGNISAWCVEGKNVLLGNLTVHCPLLAKINDRSLPIEVIDFVPSIYCHPNCSACSVAGDHEKCLSCKDGGYLLHSPGPSRCCNSPSDVGCGGEQEKIPPGCVPGSLRLANGPTVYEGRVEVCIDGQWSQVCDNYWSRSTGVVACKQLGFSTVGVKPTCCSRYGSSSNLPTLLSGLVCSGHENSLVECVHVEVSRPCLSFNVAGLQCTGPCDEGGVMLAGYGGQEVKGKGIPLVCVNGSWAVVCDSHWSHEVASSICRNAGYSPHGALALRHQQMQSIVYDSLKTIVIIGDCGSNKTAFSECQKKLFQCRKNELAGVICQSKDAVPNYCNHGEVSLSNGTFGRVSVCINNVWITVCGKGWGLNDAVVVCRYLGFDVKGTMGLQIETADPGAHFLSLNYIACSGSERNILDCGFLYFPFCSKRAGVICNINN